MNKKQYAKSSGVERDPITLFRFFSNEKLLYRLMKFQELFYTTNLESAYILLARKESGKNRVAIIGNNYLAVMASPH